MDSSSFFLLATFQMAHGVLDHHHRTVHDHPEIDRAELSGSRISQTPPFLGNPKAWPVDHQRDDERGSQIAKKKQKNTGHQQAGLQKISPHGLDRAVNDFGLIGNALS